MEITTKTNSACKPDIGLQFQHLVAVIKYFTKFTFGLIVGLRLWHDSSVQY